MVKLLMTLYQRRYNNTGGSKRIASLLQSLLIGALYVAISVVRLKGLPSPIIYISIILVPIVGVIFRKQLFPYKTECSECGSKLKIDQILFKDSEICSQCKK